MTIRPDLLTLLANFAAEIERDTTAGRLDWGPDTLRAAQAVDDYVVGITHPDDGPVARLEPIRECGRDRRGVLHCRPDNRCDDCPLRTLSTRGAEPDSCLLHARRGCVDCTRLTQDTGVRFFPD